MTFQLPRPLPVLVSALAAASMVLAFASCSHLTPLGPTPPQPRHLGSPIVLQAMSVKSGLPGGVCPAGSAPAVPIGIGISWKPLSPSPGGGPPTSSRAVSPESTCYSKVGAPLTITSAAVSPIITFRPPSPSGGGTVPAQYGLTITLPDAGATALAAVTRRAFHSQGYLDISIDGTTLLIPQVQQPFTSPLGIFLASRNRAAQIRRLLVPPS